MSWIKCSERLPERGSDVLIYNGSYQFMAQLVGATGSEWWEFEDGNMFAQGEVTHWMSLPEPPKDGE